MAHFYPAPCLVALPTECHSSWLAAHIELLIFEREHTKNHPDYGRVIVLETLAERQTYLKLLDAEMAERRAMDAALTAAADAEPGEVPSAPLSCPAPF